MAAVIIPPDTIVCGHPWQRWVDQATKFHGISPTIEQVRDFIANHEAHLDWEKRVLAEGRELQLKTEMEILLQEVEFRHLLRTKYPQRYDWYVREFNQIMQQQKG